MRFREHEDQPFLNKPLESLCLQDLALPVDKVRREASSWMCGRSRRVRPRIVMQCVVDVLLNLCPRDSSAVYHRGHGVDRLRGPTTGKKKQQNEQSSEPAQL